MDIITFENYKFIYNGKDQTRILLDCTDFLSNKSRVPMHSLSDNLTIPDLIFTLVDENDRLSEGTEEWRLALANLTIDIIVASCLVKTAFPVNALEMGAVSGIVGYHLASILGKFNPESLLCGVSNSFGNDGVNRWLNRIALIEETPRLSFLASDYDDTHLQECCFDLIVINGTVNFEDPCGIVQEAERLIKNNGTIICYSVDSPLLESCFQTVFPQRIEYSLADHVKVITVQHFKSPGNRPMPDPLEEIYNYIKEINQIIVEKGRIDIEDSLVKIREYLGVAVKERNTEVKIQLIDLRDSILEYILF